MPSKRHETVKKILTASIGGLRGNLPKVRHLRNMLEFGSMFMLLPWGVHYEVVQLGNIDGQFIGPTDADQEKLLLYFHGGGYSIGSSQTHRSLVGQITKESNIRALLINYRKAPEHPFPAAVNDAVSTYRKLLKRGFKPENIIFGGDSAGGGLVISTQLALKQRQLPLPAAGICISPWVDLVDMSGSIVMNDPEDPLIDTRKLRIWAERYAGKYHMTHSLVSPLYGNFENLPPMLIQISTSEMLYDNAIRLAIKAKKADVQVTLQEWDGLIHWWHLFRSIVPEADEAIHKIAEFIKATFQKKESAV